MSSIRSISRNIKKNKMKEFNKRVNTPEKLNEFVNEVNGSTIEKMRKYYEEKKKKDTKFFLGMLLMFVAYTLICEGYGKKRLQRVCGRIIQNIDSFNTGHLTHEDLPAILEEIREKGMEIDLQEGTIKSIDEDV